jgi:hypothetical protein
LTFALVSGPTGLTVSPTGAIVWSPTETQGPGTYPVQVKVTDNGNPSLSLTSSFTLTVNEVNGAPVLPAQGPQIINELALLTVNNSASDFDVPANVLSYQLISPPSGAAITASGVITWTPTETQGPATYTLTTVVTDNGTPPLSTTNSFTVTVNENVISRPLMGTPVVTSTTVTLFWTAIPGRTYRVQYKEDLDLNMDNWTDLPGDVTASASTASTADTRTPTSSGRFYRVELLP